MAHGSCALQPQDGGQGLHLSGYSEDLSELRCGSPPSSLVQHSFLTGRERATAHWPHPKMRASDTGHNQTTSSCEPSLNPVSSVQGKGITRKR